MEEHCNSLVMIPEPIRPMLRDYLQRVEVGLPGLLEGVYLHGSIALGAFNPRLSDIDFIAVLARCATERDIDALRQVHMEVASTHPEWELEGSYLQWTDLGRFEDAIAPCPYYAEGQLHPRGHYEINSVTWWMLKQHGLALRGPDPRSLDFEVDFELLLANMSHNLNSYWASFTRREGRMKWLLSDQGVQWAVLGVLRQFYTFRERRITSKSGAGEYALAHLPARWHRLIREALNLREQPEARSLYRCKIVRAAEAVSFLRYVITDYSAREKASTVSPRSLCSSRRSPSTR
jgi:predicted nucleotidyltransferase